MFGFSLKGNRVQTATTTTTMMMVMIIMMMIMNNEAHELVSDPNHPLSFLPMNARNILALSLQNILSDESGRFAQRVQYI